MVPAEAVRSVRSPTTGRAPPTGRGRRGGFLPCLRDGRGLGLRAIPLHVAAYIRTHPGSVPTVEAELGGHPGALRLALRPPGLLQP